MSKDVPGPPAQVRAAGAVLWRYRAAESDAASDPAVAPVLEIAIVHRPRYDDWSLPKGKVDFDESFEQAALREVEEEVALRCRLEEELPSAYYYAGGGRTKVVRWWRMTPVEDLGFTPNEEVDRRKWCRPHKALQRLTYEHDRRLIEALFADELRDRAGR